MNEVKEKLNSELAKWKKEKYDMENVPFGHIDTTYADKKIKELEQILTAVNEYPKLKEKADKFDILSIGGTSTERVKEEINRNKKNMTRFCKICGYNMIHHELRGHDFDDSIITFAGRS